MRLVVVLRPGSANAREAGAVAARLAAELAAEALSI